MRTRVCALVTRGNKMLALAYDYPGGRVFAIPGGTVEDGETIRDCLVREFEEELGIIVKPGCLRFVAEMLPHHQLGHTIHLIFEAELLSGTPRINSSQTSAAEWLWLDLATLPEIALYPAINSAIVEDLHGEQIKPRFLGPCLAREWA